MKIDSYDPGNGNTGGGANGGGSNNQDSSSNDDNSGEDETTIGISPNDGYNPDNRTTRIECNKIKKITEETDTTKIEYKFYKRYKEMRDTVVNLVNEEVSIGIAGQAQGLNEHRGNPNTEFPIISSRIKAFAHTHDSCPTGTYSVFSWADLQTFAEQSYNNKLEDDFIAFLATNNGTEFVLSIRDASKLIEFFGPVVRPIPNSSDVAAYRKFQNATFKRSMIHKKYYSSSTPLIDEIHTTPFELENELKAFLMMIKEADLGVEIFRPKIGDPDNYEKLELDNTNNIKTTSC